MQLSSQIKAHIKKSFDEFEYANLEVQRGRLFRSICDEIASTNKTGNVDLGKALSIYFHVDKEFARELSFVRSLQGDNTFKNQFEKLEADKVDGQDSFTRAAQPVASDAGAGQNDLSDQLVVNSITARIEQDSAIMSFVDKKSTLGYQSVKFPIFSSTVFATKKTVSAAFDDFSDDTTGGIKDLDKVEITPQKIGFTKDFEAEAFVKLNASFASQLTDIMTKLYLRGVKQDLYLGAGTGATSTGMFTNATTVTYTSSAATTIQKMLAAVGTANRGSEGYFLLTNTAGASLLAFEKLNNDAFNANINLGAPGLAGTVMGLPIIIDDALVTSGSSPSVTTALYLGSKGMYKWAEGLPATIETDKYQNFKTGLQTVRIMGINGGKPAFADSFAKTTLPNIY
jgi:hypothetical protein